MLLKFPYGKSFLQAEISEERLEVAISRPLEPLRDLREAVKQGLRNPIGSKPLRLLLGRGKKVCLIVPDETRVCPTKEILPPVLEELEACEPQGLEILIGNGLHRGMSEQEMIELLGEEVVKECNVTNHAAADERQLVDLGVKTSYGTPAIVNRGRRKAIFC